MNALTRAADAAEAVLSVTELNRRIKERLESDPRLLQCRVVGEISNFKHHPSGHMYFTLKDETSRIRAVMFSSRNRRLQFQPEDGMRVIAFGSVGVFERDGQYQLYVEDLEPDGLGALYVRYEQLRQQLAAEGLFAQEKKRPLPRFPLRVGVVTSPTGAVIRDICTTIERRYPLARVVLAPAQVQGPDAAPTIVRALELLYGLEPKVDVIIVGRGGGSLEELWPFNEEMVVRAVARSPVPVVSAVGHETDVTLCDFAADVRAATPTAAAELVCPHQAELRAYLEQASARARKAAFVKVARWRDRLSDLATRPVLRDPARIIAARRQLVDYIETRVREAQRRPIGLRRRALAELERRLQRVELRGAIQARRRDLMRLEHQLQSLAERQLLLQSRKLDGMIGKLEALNPLAVLRRGYSVILDEDGHSVITSAQSLVPGKRIGIRMHDGTVEAEVKARGGDAGGRVEQLRLDL
ncbi:exodeoxyribonuclease VII large subunit [Alicyclobacillus sendaiensis]|uniref:Exodeoxyribonuclease 7 large subunit n=1 Tax=Alicyclobacillus sendaiensis PA2 TaxID=3029425 RepID=A0ABT6XXU5_ALISE|nr:exodeoxyribonuclease VII large subunit [Alicyclobacillus sendaiensis]MDI9259911.1 exodeoxyribonuclease VII large subunit [Alicyclobacillus sendaiensis PA2]